MGHMKKVNEKELSGSVNYFLPHLRAKLRPRRPDIDTCSFPLRPDRRSEKNRMINMCPPDQKLQLILWRAIELFQLTTVTYGTAFAPFLATRCLVQLAEDGEYMHPVAAKVVSPALIAQKPSVKLTDSAGLTLRKWNSNCGEVLSKLQSHLREDRVLYEMDSPPPTAIVKTLGLVWCPSSYPVVFLDRFQHREVVDCVNTVQMANFRRKQSV